MRFLALRNYLMTDKGLTRKTATLGARALLGVDTVEDWEAAASGGDYRQPLLTAGEYIKIEALGLIPFRNMRG